MSKSKKLLRSPWMTALLFVLAAALLLGSGIGGTRAALTYFSDTYTSGVEMFDIGVSLVENGTAVSWRNYGSAANGSWNEKVGVLLANMLGENEKLQLGRSYPEVLSVQNSGNIDQYVRVTLYKYWSSDAEGRNKVQDVDPAYIDLHLTNLDSSWIEDPGSATDERTVLYYNGILAAGTSTAPLSDTITVSGDLGRKVTTSETTETRADGNTYRVVKTTYEYNGLYFQLRATVDAVQTHNAAEAIKSAWGVDPAILGVR